ncbi:MAG: galactose oxidase early set domain-containing protein [Planctomycetota bacterium]
MEFAVGSFVASAVSLSVALLGDPARQGQWLTPIELGISCEDTCCPTGTGLTQDEIVHVNLIPVGPCAGSLLLWTRCDFGQAEETPYLSYIWDPASGAVQELEWPAAMTTGPFCAGHCWALDPLDRDPAGAPKAKLFVAGGRENAAPFTGSREVLAFDPYTLEWDLSVPDLPGPPGGLAGFYYPSLIAMPGAGPLVTERYQVWSVGGSTIASNEPAACVAIPPVLSSHWFRLTAKPATSKRSWETIGPLVDAGEEYRWHQYPRLFVLSSGEVLHAGHAVTCESGPTPEVCPDSHFDDRPGVSLTSFGSTQCDLGYGQRPTHILDPSARQPWDPNDPLHPNADELRPANPEAEVDHPLEEPEWTEALSAGRNVGGWHYCNAAILHTLRNRSWPVDSHPPGTTDSWALDRVIVTGGIYKQFPEASGETATYYGMRACLEYDSAAKSWRVKATPPRPRALGSSFVILPTGQLFLVGGLQHNVPSYDAPNTIPDLFDPAIPSMPGTWTAQAERTKEGGSFYPRGYHSAAILLPNGQVALMGGREFDSSPSSGDPRFLNPSDTVELFEPGYIAGARPRPEFEDAPAAIVYPTRTDWNTFTVRCKRAATVTHAALIGVGSVTHHFDYGQRLIELPVRRTEQAFELEIVPPPNDALAPPGWYLLFLLDIDDIPSTGAFVRVDYER